MRYVQIWADYMSTGIRDENLGFINPNELKLAPELIRRLENWLERYKTITILDDQERASQSSEIFILDKEGIEIARAIQSLMGDTGKVTYFSEGLLKKLPI